VSTVSTAAYFLGVDGGGSKTLAVVTDTRGRERGRGFAGSSNQEVVGVDRAVAELHAAVARAVASAGAALPVRAAWLGLAGVDRPPDRDALLPGLSALAAEVRITNDAELALGALPRMVGVALIAGTGSIALGRDAAGATARAGGWGHVLGDEGSGYAIGQQALHAAVRAADGRDDPTLLLEQVLAHWHLDAPDQLIGRAYQPFDKATIAALAPLVLAAARAGDQAARRIVAKAADELALTATTVARALAFTGAPVPLALGGGLLLGAPPLRARVLRRIRRTLAVDAVLMRDPALCAARALACTAGDSASEAGMGATQATTTGRQRRDR
jgi:N-acetylglucosamine kinase-like BadF-type ATPase